MDGIKPRTRQTRKYYGILVVDYGFSSVMKLLKKKYPSLIFDDDTPIKARRGSDLGWVHHIKVNKFPFGESHEVLAMWSPEKESWNFFENDDRIDIHELLVTLDNGSDGRIY